MTSKMQKIKKSGRTKEIKETKSIKTVKQINKTNITKKSKNRSKAKRQNGNGSIVGIILLMHVLFGIMAKSIYEDAPLYFWLAGGMSLAAFDLPGIVYLMRWRKKSQKESAKRMLAGVLGFCIFNELAFFISSDLISTLVKNMGYGTVLLMIVIMYVLEALPAGILFDKVSGKTYGLVLGGISMIEAGIVTGAYYRNDVLIRIGSRYTDNIIFSSDDKWDNLFIVPLMLVFYFIVFAMAGVAVWVIRDEGSKSTT